MIELKKLMFKYKKEDKEKSKYLLMLIDTIQKLAKEKKVDENKVIKEGAKKYIKQLEDSIKNGVDVKNELDFILSLNLIPKMKSKEETITIVQNILSSNNFELPKDFGKVMGKLKQVDNIDMKLASQLLKEMK